MPHTRKFGIILPEVLRQLAAAAVMAVRVVPGVPAV
jgi:hypothetical protein